MNRKLLWAVFGIGLALHQGSWQADDVRLREAGVNRLIVYETDRDQLLIVLARMLASPAQWPLLSGATRS